MTFEPALVTPARAAPSRARASPAQPSPAATPLALAPGGLRVHLVRRQRQALARRIDRRRRAPASPRNGAASSESRVASISASNASVPARRLRGRLARLLGDERGALRTPRGRLHARAPVRPAETAPRRPAPGHRLLPGGLLGGARPGAVAASSGVEGARFISFFVFFSSAAAEAAASGDGGIERCVSEIASSGASETVSGPSPAAAAAGASRGSGNPGGATSETGPSLRSTERDSSPRRLLESASNHSQGGVSASNTAGAAGAAAFDAADAFRFGP